MKDYIAISQHNEETATHYILPRELLEGTEVQIEADRKAPTMGERDGVCSMLFLLKSLALWKRAGDLWPGGCSTAFYDEAAAAWNDFCDLDEVSEKNLYTPHPTVMDQHLLFTFEVPDDMRISAFYSFYIVN